MGMETVLRPQYEWRHEDGYVGLAIYDRELTGAEIDQVMNETPWTLQKFEYVEWSVAL